MPWNVGERRDETENAGGSPETNISACACTA